MKKVDYLKKLLDDGHGYVKFSDALDLGISAPYFYEFVENESLTRVTRGLYKTDDAWDDEHFVISTLNKRACFSHETALQLNELMERDPRTITVTLPRGYNATHLRKQNIRVFHLDKKLYELGMTKLETSFGHLVTAYDRERAMCDLLRNKADTDVQFFQAAFHLYMERRDKNIPSLMSYAKAFKLEGLMRKYLEVLL